jgi:hypothetical protein
MTEDVFMLDDGEDRALREALDDRNLQRASQERHLRAFRRCESRYG